MRASRFLLKTLRNAPGDIEAISHEYMLRAGFIQQVAAGIFNIMPLGWRSLHKIRNIIREEMNAAEALEITMPMVQPRTLWQESGRAETYNPPLAQFQDRRERDMVLAPTHEETASLMARHGITSYRDLPLRIYQIQLKYRNEPRARAGLLRAREFEMKDAYSFDADPQGMDESYDAMAQAYFNIFSRCGLNAVMVEADSGSIGGKDSAEFVLPADAGEDVMLICNTEDCKYAANLEKAEFAKTKNPTEKSLPIEEFATPNVKTIEALAELENQPRSKTAKAVFYIIDGRVHIVVIRGDYEVNETKLRNLADGNEPRLAEPEEVADAGFVSGSASAVGVDPELVIVDDSIIESPNLIAGANQADFHLRNVNYGRDYTSKLVGDIAEAYEGANCSRCESGVLTSQKGIEVGHIFKLVKIYSEPMKVVYNTENGSNETVYMGCYGIGTGRLLAAAVEANHDDRGMVLPPSIAPFQVALLGINMYNDENVRQTAESIYKLLTNAGFEVLFDDRDEAPGVKFADADLIGMPVRVVVSPRSLQNGGVEIKRRNQPPSESEICEAESDKIISTIKHALGTPINTK